MEKIKAAKPVMNSTARQHVSKHFDIVLAIDFHWTTIPLPPSFGFIPLPLPHPFVGMVFDPMDYLHFDIPVPSFLQEKVGAKSIPMGGSIYVHGRHKATTTTSVMGVLLPFRHISSIPGLYFIVNIPGSPHEGEVYWGSTTVLAQGTELSGSDPQQVLTCWCPPMGLKMLPTMPNKIKKNPLAYFAFYNDILSMYVQINTGGPVLVGGAFAPHQYTAGEMLMRFAGMALIKGLGKFGGALSKKALTGVNKILQKAFGKTNPVSKKLCRFGLEPVNFVTGAMFFEWTDFELPGGTPLQWSNAWRSDKPYAGMLGNGVYNSYDLYIIPDAAVGIAGFQHPKENMVMPLPYIEVGAMPYYDRAQKVWMERPDDNTWIIILEQDTYVYRLHREKEGDIFRINAIRYAEGTSLSFGYHSGSHLLSTIKDNTGRTLELECNPEEKHITAVYYRYKQIRDLMISYSYDDNNNLVSVTDVAGKQLRFCYDQQNRVVQRVNRNGISYFWEYDAAGRVMHTYGPDGYQEGYLKYYPELGYNEVAYADGRTESYCYDENDLLYKEVDAMGGETWYEYTRYNERKMVASPEGRLIGYEYDEQGNISVYHTPEGEQFEYEYNKINQLTLRKEPSGLSESWEYNEQHQLIQYIQKDGRIQQYFYDAATLLPSSCTDDLGHSTYWQYNEQRLLVAEKDDSGKQTTWRYDDYGRLSLHNSGAGKSTLLRRDNMGRVIKYKESGQDEIQFAYDAYDLPVYAADNKEEWLLEYTPMGNLKRQVRRNRFDRTNNRTLRFNYDRYDELTSVINEKEEQYSFARNGNNEVIEETGFDGSVRQYIRNRDGEILKTVLPNGKNIYHTYDLAGRLVYNRYEEGYWEAYRYNASGLLESADNPSNAIQFKRNAQGEITEEKQGEHRVTYSYDDAGILKSVKSSLGATLQREYDLLGVQGHIFAAFRNREWSARIHRNHLGQELKQELQGAVVSDFEYDHEGRPVSQKIRHQGSTVFHQQYQWKNNHKLLSSLNKITGNKVDYHYDSFGNLSAALYEDKELVYRSTDAAGNLYKTKNNKDRIYAPGGRLLKDDQWYYRYDESGNLALKSKRNINDLGPYRTDAGAPLRQWAWHTTDNALKDEEAALAILPETPPSQPEWEKGDWAYSWYPNGMLQMVRDPEGRETRYEYDALGRRTAKICKERIQRFLWDGNVVLHEWSYALQDRPKLVIDAAGKLSYDREEPVNETLVTWIYEQDSFTPIARLATDKSYSIVSDYMGTPVAAFDEQGRKVWSCELDIYGKVRKITGERSLIPFRYQGQYEDEETGLYYNRFRYYDPERGNYISKDMIGLLGGTALYNYVHDVNGWLDVFGLAGGMKGATSTVTAGNASSRLPSKTPIHSEMRNLGELNKTGALRGQDVVITDVIGHFPENVNKTVGVCAECREGMFAHLIDGEANSVTIPKTRGSKILKTVKIPKEHFAAAQAELKAINDKYLGTKKYGARSKESYAVLEKYQTYK